MIGDSIFAGGQSKPAAMPVGTLLTIKLGRRYRVINLACGGSATSAWTPHTRLSCPNKIDGPPFESRVVPVLPADWVVVLLGTNDSGYYHPPRPPQLVEDNLRAIAEGALSNGAKRVMLVIPPPRPPQSLGGERIAALQDYRDRILRLCEEDREIMCGPDLFYLLDKNSDFAVGNVHPNAMGHEKIAQLIADQILDSDRWR
jgi:hypothetical protein